MNPRTFCRVLYVDNNPPFSGSGSRCRAGQKGGKEEEEEKANREG